MLGKSFLHWSLFFQFVFQIPELIIFKKKEAERSAIKNEGQRKALLWDLKVFRSLWESKI